MAQVNTNNYKEALNYLNNSSIYEQNKAKIISVVNHLDSRILSIVNEDLSKAKETLNNEIEAEKTIKTTISTKIDRYIEIESKARERASLITGSVVGAAGVVAGMSVAPVATPVVVPVIAAVGVSKKDATLQFIKDVGEGIFKTGAKVVEGVKSFTTKAFNGIVNFGKKAKKVFATIGEKTKNIVSKALNLAENLLKAGAKLVIGFYASAANLLMSALEGLSSLGEALRDAVVMLGGIGKSLIVTGPQDLVGWIGSKIYKTEFSSKTKALWTEKIMPYVGINHVGLLFDELYKTKLFNGIENAAWGAFKRDGGTAYSIGKSIGYTAGAVALTVVTAGAFGVSAAAVSSVTVGVAGTGKAVQSNYNKLDDSQKGNMGAIAKVLFSSSLSGLVEGVAWYYTFGNGTKRFVDVKSAKKERISNAWNKGLDVIFDNKLTNKLFSKQAPAKMLEMVKKSYLMDQKKLSKMIIQVEKTYLSSAASEIMNEHDGIIDYMGDILFSKENLINAGTSAFISLKYDNNNYIKEHVVNKLKGSVANTSKAPVASRVVSKIKDLFFNKTFKQEDLLSNVLPKVVNNESQVINQEYVSAAKDGIGKIAGSFIKKLYDRENIIGMVGETIPHPTE